MSENEGDNVLEALLIYCLDELEAGVPAEELLARYPAQAEQIQPVLATAALLQDIAPQPSAAAQADSSELFLAHARAMKQSQPRLRPVVWWRRLGLALGVFVLLFVAFLAAASETTSALPGTPLYDVKRSAEMLRLNLARTEARKAALLEQYEEERMREINTLLDQGGRAEVTCRGLVEASGELVWRICGLETVVNSDTRLDGELEVGAWVLVEGFTEDGRFVATSITILRTGGELPLVAPEPEATPEPTATSEPEPVTPTPTVDAEGDDDPDDEDEAGDEDLDQEDESDPEEGEEEEDNSGSGSGSDDEEEEEDNSGSGSGSDDEEEEEDNSGSGSGSDDEEEEEDNSGSGSGSDDEEEEEEDNSGSGSGSDDEEEEEDNSGSGSGSDDEEEEEDNSGSGSGSDDEEEEEDNSGSGSGSDDEEEEEDNSGSGSGSDDEEEEADNSGSGSGSDDEEEEEEDNSGSGS